MRKKFLTIGLVALFILVFFTPPAFAVDLFNTEVKEESVPDTPNATRIYGIAIVNGTTKEPKSLFPFIGKLFGYKFLFYTYFTNGIIKPVFAITGLREINIPDDYSLAKIHGTICKWDKFEQIGDTDTYSVSGTIIPLVVDLYRG